MHSEKGKKKSRCRGKKGRALKTKQRGAMLIEESVVLSGKNKRGGKL